METLQPRLRFPEFDGNNNKYEKYSFNDIFIFSTGKNIKQKEASPEFEIPCVRYGELYHMYNEVIKVVINRTNIDKSELIFSKGDEILLPSAGEDPLDIGSASALTLENVAIGRTINILKPLKQDVYSNIYVSYFINHKLRKKIATLAKGVSISNVYNSDLKTLEINLPPLQEQTKIANFLSSVDEKLNLLKEKKETLEEYKKGIMQKIFNQDIRFKDDNGNDFEDREEKSLGDIANIYQPKTISQKDLKLNGYDVYGANGIIGKYDKFNHDLEQIAITCRGNTCGTVNFTKPKSWITGNAMVINIDKNKNTNKKYLFFLLSNTNFTYLITGSGQPQITGNIKYHKAIFPSIEEQTKIADFLSAIDGKIELVNTQIEDTKEYKKGLLQQMFV